MVVFNVFRLFAFFIQCDMDKNTYITILYYLVGTLKMIFNQALMMFRFSSYPACFCYFVCVGFLENIIFVVINVVVFVAPAYSLNSNFRAQNEIRSSSSSSSSISSSEQLMSSGAQKKDAVENFRSHS